MQVILLEKIYNLGNLGDTVKVKPGYGRNYLVPFGKAVAATTTNIARFEERRAELEKKAEESLVSANKRAEKLKDISVVIKANASEDGKLYGSVGVGDIVHALADLGHHVEKREVILTDGAIHELGSYTVELILHSDVTLTFNLEITPA